MRRKAFTLAALVLAMLATTAAAADQAKLTIILDGATTTTRGRILRPSSPQRTFQAYGATASGSGSATIVIEVSNVDAPASTDWITLATITLTLGTTRTTDGFASNAAWRNVSARVTAISGTGAAVSVIAGEEVK